MTTLVHASGPFTYANSFADFLGARDRGECCEIDEELYWYFLEVLPPKFMGRVVEVASGQVLPVDFEFAEGMERITAFWKTMRGNYYAQFTNEIAELD